MALNLEAFVLMRSGDTTSANVLASQALLALATAPATPVWWRADIMGVLGETSLSDGRLAAAETYFNTAIRIRKDAFGEGAGTLRLRTALARAYQAENMNTNAIIAYREALTIARSLPRDSLPFTGEDLIPLAVDVDYTLLRTDLFAEGLVHILRDQPQKLRHLLGVFLRHGIVGLKEATWTLSRHNFTKLPLNTDVAALMAQANKEGRKVILCSAGCEDAVKAVGDSLDFPVQCVGSGNGTNLKGSRKAEFLVSRFGDKGFDYIGDAEADLPVWAKAHKAIMVGVSGALAAKVAGMGREVEQLPGTTPSVKSYMKALRPHQWMKNLLVFLPMLVAHKFDYGSIRDMLLAFVAFSLVASTCWIWRRIARIRANVAAPLPAGRSRLRMVR